MTILHPPIGNAYCCKCGKQINAGDLIGFQTTNQGTLQIGHVDCQNE